ncbi:MAG: chromosome segregation protein SMC [Caldilineaceae bacterium]|nr:chromosome segregation protein SMC [Caldilineaceae bacterium]
MLRIKRVEIQGFKTFATKTEFVFDPGVTAIVGPNGSGKSNVADAVRWCMGEQSFGLLRSKKTADVIFSGSDKKARLGMATVSITFDNSDGDLPIDFTEVEIARRAYRDGENEYLLNGQKVRLSDVTQLLAPSGLGKRTYAVIGQGLIDQVLSLKPEERRALFEEAAGITGYQTKRATALRRLEATQQNLERAQDIIAELSPRLGYLRRQAERAHERAQVEADLKGLLHQWYGYRWHRTLADLREYRIGAKAIERIVKSRRQQLEKLGARIEELRSAQNGLREQLNAKHRASSDRHRQAEAISRALAVAQERHRQIGSRREELAREMADLRLEREGLAARQAEFMDAVAAAEADYRQQQSAVDALQRDLSQRQAERAILVERLDAARKEERLLAERSADRQTRLAQIDEQRRHLHAEQSEQQETLANAHVAVEEAAIALAQAEADAEQATADLADLQRAIEDLEARIGPLRQELEEKEAVRREADRVADRLQTRYELLERLRNEGAGYVSGVRAVLQAAQLTGILGTVASQLNVPAELDKAVETALGGAYQNILTESWDDTRRAIDYLKGGRGRATFLPLNRLSVAKAIPAPRMAGILGNAADLVEYDRRVADAIEGLLNRTWVAQDLPAARRALDAHRGPQPTVVTLDGEIIRPGGAVTGGNDGRRQDESVLAREREHRRLPDLIRAARQNADEIAASCRALSSEIEGNRAEVTQLREEERSIRSQERQAQGALEAARSRLAQAEQKVNWQQELMGRRGDTLQGLDQQEESYRAELAALQIAAAEISVAVQAAEAAMRAQGINDLLQQLAEARAAAADAQGTLRSRQAVFNEQRRGLETVSAQIASRGDRLRALEGEDETLAAQIKERSGEEASVSGEIATLQAEIDPAERELAALESAQQETENDERNLQQLLRQDETNWNAAQLQLQRTEDRMEALREEIRHDFGLAVMEESDDVAYQPPLPLQTVVAQLPVVTDLPAGLDEEVQETRARLRRLSNVNPEAPKEYEEAAGRHDFLISQSADLEAAAADLRRVIRELDKQMEEALRRTFDAVSKEFIHYFELLFQGGTAKLTLTTPEDIINTGVEILARPPGKRPQSLELLSGGERSLTACALIFAILRVSPTPFCILDEVDAALDEANVDRFRTVLEGLIDHTQFIIITHNRRTLEASNTIYGITMGDDGVSRVISLRLEGDEMVEMNGKVAAEEAVAM